MKTAELMEKAARAVASAKLFLAAGDVDGACNRAYYAMFDAAKAALLWSGAPVEPTVARTHSGLISAFSLHLVKMGHIAVEIGRSMNRVSEIRMIADYTGDEVTIDKAQSAITQADLFVGAIRTVLTLPAPSKSNP